ncbi:MAG TPA: hypothetical protein VH062_02085 [Polyangiaceae bacterium]|nr:hypothetical protein [Polyangiaceae bacterium]
MLTHTQAKSIVDALPGMTAAKSLFCRLVAWHETNYGAGWKEGEGAGSNNMGAITTTHPDQYSFKHVDSKFDDAAGKVVPYTTWFAGDPTPALGFKRLVDTICRSSEVTDALACNDFLQATTGMYDEHYFLGLHTHANPNGDRLNIEDYYAALIKALGVIGHETGEVQPDVLPPEGAS